MCSDYFAKCCRNGGGGGGGGEGVQTQGRQKLNVFTLESPYPYFCCNLRHNVMPYMFSEMQNKLSKIRESPLESMGQIISSRCPCVPRISLNSHRIFTNENEKQSKNKV